MRVLVVNAGSSTLKLSLIDEDDATIGGHELATPGERIDPAALRTAIEDLADADAVGHRIVHGGERFLTPVPIDAEVESALRELTDLAPLHQPKSLAAFDAVSKELPDLPAVACFDTAFHATIPPAAATYALPQEWRERWPLRRYGFHGLSHAWVARRAAQLVGREEDKALRIVSCHLGAGGSLCAILGGRSVETTMGFTPLEGLVMATRSGSVDPGLVLWLTDGRLSADTVSDGLEHHSGLLGLAGTADMREVLERAERGDKRAAVALEVYLHRLRAGIAAMTASLSGIDVLAFTGGVGERSAEVRARAVCGLEFLGVGVDEARNRAASADTAISADDARVQTLVVTAREDLEVAQQTRSALDLGGSLGHGTE
jgi:acetate kinase